ncbi:hypothetical protein MTDSW087_03617 [Methylobacterium dankookense]|uniref:Uncharacterized protein n=2 Tax=Methylobacterium dankookense TaxID=560405 RepID=A0A564G0A4_9HYPH|nr:hypothetical protein IFDJLNFL_3328 [Methylobacterium dankookense]VUF13909.1 hypothetical protein MTDSW087_03617 [Methylobacterium dankookense]
MAAGFALGGLTTMMFTPIPSWESVNIGGTCLLMFGVLWLVPLVKPPKPLRRRRRPIRYEIIEAPNVPDRPRRVREMLPTQLPEYPALRSRLQPWRTKRLSPHASPPQITTARPK